MQSDSTTTSASDAQTRNIKVPLGGDLLGRERVIGAKRLRMGCDQPSDRFENIVETPALWHAKQAFLKVKFCKLSTYGINFTIIVILPTMYCK